MLPGAAPTAGRALPAPPGLQSRGKLKIMGLKKGTYHLLKPSLKIKPTNQRTGQAISSGASFEPWHWWAERGREVFQGFAEILPGLFHVSVLSHPVI